MYAEEPKMQFERSINLYRQIIEGDFDYRDMDGAYYMLAYCHMEERSSSYNLSSGRHYFEEMVSRFPNSEFANDAHMRLGEFYFEENNLQRATAHYRLIVEGGEAARHYDKGLYKLAWAEYRNNQYANALKLFTRLLDYSRRQRLATGQLSEMDPEAIRYMAISFSEIAGVEGRPHQVANKFFQRVTDREYEKEVYRELVEVLFEGAELEKAIDTLVFLQKRWPLDPDNPELQKRVAGFYRELPVPNFEAAADAERILAERYADKTDWWRANENNPDALAVAKSFIRDSLSEVAVNYHLKAQESGVPSDYVMAAEKYGEYLEQFPFADNYYEMKWYLADSLLGAQKFEAGLSELRLLLEAKKHPFKEPALYRSWDTRRQLLLDQFGGGVEEGVPDWVRPPAGSVVERTIKTKKGNDISVYTLSDEHRSFIELCDRLYSTSLLNPKYDDDEHKLYEEFRRNALPALAYEPAQILYAFGYLDAAEERFQRVLELYPRKNEGLFAASMIVRIHQDREDLRKVNLYTGKFLSMSLGDPGVAESFRGDWKDNQIGSSFNLAAELFQTDQFEAAGDAFLKFIDDYPQAEDTQLIDALFFAANAFENAGQVQRANGLLEQYINQYPKDERSENFFFRIATNYAGILELEKAITYYEQLGRNFKDSENAPAAMRNAAFLRIGIGDNAGAARRFEEYARRFADAEDAEAVFYKAGEEWEKVGDEEALAFYERFLRKYGDNDPDRTLESQYKIIEMSKRLGKRDRKIQAEWDKMAQLFDRMVQQHTLEKIGSKGRRYAAEGAFAPLLEQFDEFKAVEFKADEVHDGVLIGLLPQDMDPKITPKTVELDGFLRACLNLVTTYQEFEYASAALYLQAAAYYEYANMIRQIPTPTKYTKDKRELSDGRTPADIWREQFERALPADDIDAKAIESAQKVLSKAAEEQRWGTWQTTTLNLLADIDPVSYSKEKGEFRMTTSATAPPAVGPVSVKLEDPNAAEEEGQ